MFSQIQKLNVLNRDPISSNKRDELGTDQTVRGAGERLAEGVLLLSALSCLWDRPLRTRSKYDRGSDCKV